MRLPGVRIQPFTFAQSELARLENGAALVKELDLYPNENPKFMVLGDPATCDRAHGALFNEGYPGAPLVGGMASGMIPHKPSWLLLGSHVWIAASRAWPSSAPWRYRPLWRRAAARSAIP